MTNSPTPVLQLVRRFCPPRAKTLLRRLRARALQQGAPVAPAPDRQDLDLYWDAEMAAVLETWGEDNVWNEIQLLIANCSGKVLDIACGPGKTIDVLSGMSQIEVHGCDISDFFIGKALARGIPRERLEVCDATQLPYADGSFDYSYSIGSLEHFTLEGVSRLLTEARRVTSRASFHMIPVSRSGRDEGWMKTVQSFHNNSVPWWLTKFQSVFATVHAIPSAWNDDISVGRWFVCTGHSPSADGA